ncbi:hypothetical protein I3843_01G060500 [Carya illinoinensis]|nr:hypothetical protein I3843_01G060500 [Carya illinoinensis]
MEWCFMCKKDGESIDHLFLHCEVARELWIGILCRTGLSWVTPKRVVEVLVCWNRNHNSSQLDAAWRMIPLCLLWCVWTERNDKCSLRVVGDIWNFFVFSLSVVFCYCIKGESVHEVLFSFQLSRI